MNFRPFFGKLVVFFSFLVVGIGSVGMPTGCGSGTSGGTITVASFSGNYRFYYIGGPDFDFAECEDPTIYEEILSETQKMQCAFGTTNQVLMVNDATETPSPDTDLTVLEQDEVPTAMEEQDIANEFTCGSSAEASTCGADPENAVCNVQSPSTAGTNGLPSGMDATWSGYGSGGCGTWATAMCNRILGRASGAVTKEEWNEIATGIGQNATGGSSQANQGAYYEGLDYCVEVKKVDKNDYSDLQEKLGENCDVKLFFWKRNADNTYSNGHTETVTAATSTSATTNSWGQSATVSGGSDGDFSHTGGAFSNSSTLWPAGSTEVWVQYICQCSVFESFARWLGF